MAAVYLLIRDHDGLCLGSDSRSDDITETREASSQEVEQECLKCLVKLGQCSHFTARFQLDMQTATGDVTWTKTQLGEPLAHSQRLIYY